MNDPTTTQFPNFEGELGRETRCKLPLSMSWMPQLDEQDEFYLPHSSPLWLFACRPFIASNEDEM